MSQFKSALLRSASAIVMPRRITVSVEVKRKKQAIPSHYWTPIIKLSPFLGGTEQTIKRLGVRHGARLEVGQ